MSASTESALQQEGALPQHGIPGVASGEQRTAYDVPDGFTAPASFNERLDPLAEGLANATTRVEEIEVVEVFIESGEAPQVVAKDDSQNADALGSPVARAPLNPVHDDTASTGAASEQPVLAQATTEAATPTDTPDSLPADKTAEQKATGEVVAPAPAAAPGAADVVGQTRALPENPPVAPTAVAQPFAENAVTNPSQPEPAALDTPAAPVDNHDPAQNTPPSAAPDTTTPAAAPNPPADTAPVEGTH
jgi:hypothetical protein